MSDTDSSDHSSDLTEEDRLLFLQSVGSVNPIQHDRAQLIRDRPAPRPTPHLNDELQVMDELLSHEIDPDVMISGEEITFQRPGLQNKRMTRLRQGRFRVQEELDLHRMNSEAARKSIEYFISRARHDGLSCVLIIHGKGLRSKGTGPVLKDLTAQVLRRIKPVMAFTSAKPMDGGTGAVYVLLRSLSGLMGRREGKSI